MVHENVHISLTVKAVVTETPDYLSLYYQRPKRFAFEAGDWMEISLPGQTLPGGKVYSFSSSPNEADLRMTFRRGVSPFKKALQSLLPGDTLLITEYGNDYGFRLKEHSSSTLIAGGVGVAPFRSMIKAMVETGSQNQVRLIYFNTSADFLFADEFSEWQQLLTGLEVHFVATKELKRKDREKLLKTLIPAINQEFYVSGPSGIVTSTVRLLTGLGVDRKSIKVDDFGHY